MPRVKQLKSLSEICLQSVAKNIDNVWCKHYVETYLQEKKLYLFVIGPFDPLPPKLLADIIDLLREEKKLKKHHLDLLIIPQLRTLDLTREANEVSGPLQLAAIRCSQLKVLKLSGCQKISKHIFQDYLPCFDKLQVLDLSITKTGDTCLLILGAYCKDLRELNVTSCPITDAGIKGLCVSEDDLGNPSERLGQCKSIQKLLIGYTKVTNTGIQIALSNLSQLMAFDCCSSVQALAEMHLKGGKNTTGNLPKYSLTELHCTNDSLSTPYISGALGIAGLSCPHVTKVRIVTQQNLSNADLLGLLELSKIYDLSISGGEVCEITFEGGIVPLLQAFGNSIESLTLAELPSVNIRAISELCPNLRSLYLIMNHNYTSSLDIELGVFTQRPLRNRHSVLNKLESAHLVCVMHLWQSSVIPSENLPSILGSPELVHLYIKDCLTLTDEVLQNAFETHRFRNLEHLELEQCHSVTKNPIDLLISVDNPLKVIKLWECRSLTRQNADELKNKASKKKWELSIDWS